jgi:hypothetical protein
MSLKELLSFNDVAQELGCDTDTVRTLVVEQRALPGRFVTLIGHAEAYTQDLLLDVDSTGCAVDLANQGQRRGYVRVTRTDLEAFREARPGLADASLQRTRGWPAHETKKLEALRLAANRFWGRYDPAEPDTAPKTEDVAEWLMKFHGIGKTPAAEMASILRPETLKAGRRRS